MVNKMKKRKIDWQPIQEMMTSTFSLRRKEIVEEETPVADIKARWPALFSERQVKYFSISGEGGSDWRLIENC